MSESNEQERTVWCGNLPEKLTEELLYELFLQAGPLERVRLCKDKDGKNSYGFVTFKHAVSVQYVVELFSNTYLYDKRINIKPRVNNQQRINNSPYNRTPKHAPRDHLMKPQPKRLHSPNMSQNLNESLDFSMLAQMGQQLLINNQVHNHSYDNGQHSSPHRNDYNYNENRPSYRRHNNDYRNERYSSNKSYHGGRHHKW